MLLVISLQQRGNNNSNNNNNNNNNKLNFCLIYNLCVSGFFFEYFSALNISNFSHLFRELLQQNTIFLPRFVIKWLSTLTLYSKDSRKAILSKFEIIYVQESWIERERERDTDGGYTHTHTHTHITSILVAKSVYSTQTFLSDFI